MSPFVHPASEWEGGRESGREEEIPSPWCLAACPATRSVLQLRRRHSWEGDSPEETVSLPSRPSVSAYCPLGHGRGSLASVANKSGGGGGRPGCMDRRQPRARAALWRRRAGCSHCNRDRRRGGGPFRALLTSSAAPRQPHIRREPS